MKKFNFLVSFFLLVFWVGHAGASILTFDNSISGATSYSFDSDGDSIDDVIFSTTDPSGFRTVGPGPNMTYINEPGLEGTTRLDTDLKVDFLNGVEGSLGFGFALSTRTNSYGVKFSVFDNADNTLYSGFWAADFTSISSGFSSAPEAYVSAAFSGIAAYATFDFSTSIEEPGRYILDNFEGTFGSTERPPVVPEPATFLLFGLGILGIAGVSRKKTA